MRTSHTVGLGALAWGGSERKEKRMKFTVGIETSTKPLVFKHSTWEGVVVHSTNGWFGLLDFALLLDTAATSNTLGNLSGVQGSSFFIIRLFLAGGSGGEASSCCLKRAVLLRVSLEEERRSQGRDMFRVVSRRELSRLVGSGCELVIFCFIAFLVRGFRTGIL